MEKREVRSAYDRFAPWYDLLEAVPDRLLGVARLRRALAQRARGRVLEVAVGTGRNLRYHPSGHDLTAVDLSPGMLDRARERAGELHRPVRLALMDTERLGFRDGSFDTVLDSLALCTYPDPVRALREMSRVCRPGGRVLLLEHGRSERDLLGRWQERHDRLLVESVGCHWAREPRHLAEEAGLGVTSVDRRLLGIFQLIEAKPAPRP